MKAHFYILFIFFSVNIFSQKDSISIKEKVNQKRLEATYNPLSPAKAAFYSAILPGAGQVYNNRYWWQVPLMYGGMATSIYYYVDNDNEYNRFRTAYKLRRAGLPDEFDGENGRSFVSEAGLESAQKQLRKNRELSLLTTLLIYILQIVEASVTAHLIQFDESDDLSLQPTTFPNPNFDETQKVGLSLKYSF